MKSDTEKIFGLIGYPLGHSFSHSFFNKKFQQEGIKAQYLNFELEDISRFPELIESTPLLSGLNVTIPYKSAVIPYLDGLDGKAEKIGAVNVIKVIKESDKTILKGYNSDIIGFKDSISPILRPEQKKALVLGTGGASKAIVQGLVELGILPTLVSRTKSSDRVLTYEELTPEIISENLVIVNTTPVGMSPKTDRCPDIPYDLLTPLHLCYDLIYNPTETLFMKRASEYGAQVKNGLDMLILQAKAAWGIWNSDR